jgi:small redox-active disulfide protein 2
MIIKVLGTGCAKCSTLERQTQRAIEKLQIDAQLEKVEDIVEIMNAGVMQTPALMINDEVVMTGKVPKVKVIEELISQKL